MAIRLEPVGTSYPLAGGLGALARGQTYRNIAEGQRKRQEEERRTALIEALIGAGTKTFEGFWQEKQKQQLRRDAATDRQRDLLNQFAIKKFGVPYSTLEGAAKQNDEPIEDYIGRLDTELQQQEQNRKLLENEQQFEQQLALRGLKLDHDQEGLRQIAAHRADMHRIDELEAEGVLDPDTAWQTREGIKTSILKVPKVPVPLTSEDAAVSFISFEAFEKQGQLKSNQAVNFGDGTFMVTGMRNGQRATNIIGKRIEDDTSQKERIQEAKTTALKILQAREKSEGESFDASHIASLTKELLAADELINAPQVTQEQSAQAMLMARANVAEGNWPLSPKQWTAKQRAAVAPEAERRLMLYEKQYPDVEQVPPEVVREIQFLMDILGL